MYKTIAKLVLTFIASLLFTVAMSGQGKTLKIGVELQGYPTGVIPGLRTDMYFNDASKLHLRIGYNIVRHGDAGEHDDERGGGAGLTIGYDILPFVSHRWTFGIRSDLWFNEIDWYDRGIQLPNVTGTTNVTVFQPTVQAGYRIPFGEEVELLPTVAFGYEFNIKTVGAAVGHGPIMLAGFVLSYEL
ncbi:MAG TPA: hypothetical protein VI603_01060 [Saprospiraceae bacterium]|nr:hypothetical protein [Saprospiraceae bacterium]